MPTSFKNLKNLVAVKDRHTSTFHLELDMAQGGFSVVISGVKRVKSLSDTEVTLACAGTALTVRGKRLMLSLYEDKSVKISGKVEVFELENTKN